MSVRRITAPGPFRADQLRSGDPYELSRGHAIHVLPTGSRGAIAQSIAGGILQSDPAVRHAGVDVGYSPEPGTLRAPDVSVLPAEPGQGWMEGVPPLAIEYADVGQDEVELMEKVRELLEKGTRYLWIVRMIGPRRVEVWTAEGMRIANEGDVLTAPGVLANGVPVDALYDAERGLEVTLDNLLQRFGYAGVQAIREEGRVEGREEGREEGRTAALRDAVRALLSSRGLAVSPDVAAALDTASAPLLLAWVGRAAAVTSAEELLR